MSSARPSTTTRPPFRHDDLPSYLVSTIVHMLGVIGLGLIHLGTTPNGRPPLLLALTPTNAADQAIDSLALADIDMVLEADKVPATTVDEDADALLTERIEAKFSADWSDLAPHQENRGALVSGLDDMTTFGEQIAGELGEGQTYASLFGVSGEGEKFVYVFDRSGSMNSTFPFYSQSRLVSMTTPLLVAKRELIRSLDSLPANSEFQIVFYNHSTFLFGDSHYEGQLHPATEEFKELARIFIEQMPGQGFTNHLLALEAGISLEPDVVFLLTDAEAKDDLHPDVVRRIAAYCARRKIVINVVHFCNAPRPGSTLRWLAETTGGQHQFISLESLAESMIGAPGF